MYSLLRTEFDSFIGVADININRPNNNLSTYIEFPCPMSPPSWGGGAGWGGGGGGGVPMSHV